MGEYTWIVIGEASRLPVATFHRRYELVSWLRSRNGVSTLRGFRLRGNISGGFEVVELDLEWVRDDRFLGK